MIKNNQTINGIPLSDLRINSTKKVIRICDYCSKEQSLTFRDVNKQRRSHEERYGQIKDRCHDCQIQMMVKERFQKAPRTFRYSRDGYRLKIDPYTNKWKGEHRVIMQEHLGRKLYNEDVCK